MTPAPHDPRDQRDDAEDFPSRSAIRLAPGVEMPSAAVRFAASRSSGPGGQNVNKRSTKVELRVPIEHARRWETEHRAHASPQQMKQTLRA